MYGDKEVFVTKSFDDDGGLSFLAIRIGNATPVIIIRSKNKEDYGTYDIAAFGEMFTVEVENNEAKLKEIDMDEVNKRLAEKYAVWKN